MATEFKEDVCFSQSSASIYALTITKDGEYLLCGGQDKSIRLYNPYKSLLIKEYNGHGYDVQCIKMENNSKSMFASCGGDKNAFLWDIKTAKILRKFWGHSQRINCLSFNNNVNNVIVSGSYDQTVLFYDLKSYRSSKSFYKLSKEYFKDSITDLLFCGHEIFVCCMDGYLRTFDIRNGKLLKDFICDKGLTSIALTNDGKCILLSCLDDTLRLINKQNGKLLNKYDNDQFVNNEYKIKSCFGCDDETVVSGSENGKILIWDLLHNKTKDKPSKMKILGGKSACIITNVSSHPTKNGVLFSSDTNGQIKIWKQ